MFLNGGRPDKFLADHFDLLTCCNLHAKYLNPGTLALLGDYFGTNVVGETNQKYQALLAYAEANGLSGADVEDMFLHARFDVDYTLGEPMELDSKVTKTIPGWDPVNDANGDGAVDDVEFATRPNPDARARAKSEARIPIYFWGPPTDYIMNIGHPEYVQFILAYANDLIVNHAAYDDPAYWENWGAASSIRVTDQPFEGSSSCVVDVNGPDENLLFKQYLTLQPNTTYTLGAAVKTEGLNGFAQVYQYEFDDVQQLSPWIEVREPTTDWSVFLHQFTTGADVAGRVTVKVYGGPGTVWFDGVHLAEGTHSDYVDLVLAPNLLQNGGCEQVQPARYDGFWLDTLRDAPSLQGNTEVLEYPLLEQYAVDIKSLLSSLVAALPEGAVIVGNGWLADPMIISGAEYENWARMTSWISPVMFDAILQRDAIGVIQCIQYNPIFDEKANPNRPDLFVEGVTLAQDQLYGLALYYLVHGDNTYFGYGVHGAYHLGEERWFDAVEYDMGQPLEPYRELASPSPTNADPGINLLANGDFEWDADGDGNPDQWLVAEPVQLDPDIKYEGAYAARIESATTINNINKQYVTLKPNTPYTLSGWIKTENVTGGGAQIYAYEFDDCAACVQQSWIKVTGTTNWTFYRLVFVTGSDFEGRINFRIGVGTGTAWFDDIHLAEGVSEGAPLYGRAFETAIVLLNPYSAVNTPVSYDLDGLHMPLRADGTLGAFTRTAFLRSGEGGIFVKAPPGSVPALAQWGVGAMSLLFLAAGTLVLRRREWHPSSGRVVSEG